MLDSIRLTVGAAPSTVHHHEHRAPTDESVRLLREMEAKADERMIERLVLNNTVKGTVIRRKSCSTFEDEVLLVFELNGERFQTKPVRVLPNYTLNKSEWASELVRTVAEAVAVSLISQHAREVLPELQGGVR
jgi:hypothetical protein